MAQGTYTLLDLATRSGVGVSSLIEGVLTYAPELQVLPFFPKSGITYTTLTRTALPSGSFRKAGAGVPLTKSEWKRETGSMMIFDAQMQINEDIVIAAKSENAELATGDILTDEASATMEGSMINISSQIWYGTTIAADGFVGLSTQVDTANNEVDGGGGSGADSSSVYLVYLDPNPVNPQGVHGLLGNGGRMSMSPEWIKQQIVDPNNAANRLMAFVNNFMSYLGLVVERPQAVYRIKNLTLASSAVGMSDAFGAQLLQKVPLKLRADLSKWRWFMNSQQLYALQKSRATVTVATGNNKGVASGGVFPDLPTSCQGIAIQPSDSLITTERNALHQ
jgi:hypothetical protein